MQNQVKPLYIADLVQTWITLFCKPQSVAVHVSNIKYSKKYIWKIFGRCVLSGQTFFIVIVQT